jgi:signal transduction histidine kinase
MMLRSFRLRLLIGSVLWTLGLLFVAHMLSLVVLHHLDPRELVQVIYVSSDHAAASGGSTAAVEEIRDRIAESRRRTFVRGALFSLVSMVAGVWLVAKGLRSLRELHARVSAVRDGREPRVAGQYPSEVQPLVNDLNALLAHRELLVERAQAKAGDLAHGLKTPLALLAQEAERASAAGQTELAASIAQQVSRMQRQIDYHLAQARAAASGSAVGAHAELLASVEGIVRALERLHAERGLDIRIDVDPSHAARVERQDLDEMLGNLLENACDWARSTVLVRSWLFDGVAIVDVDDDGPGIEPSMREAVLQRGVRADEAAPGSGLGLAIVRDLAELYGGSIVLESAPAGGLRARLRLPATS